MWKRNHSLPEQIERGLVMNENLFRPQFDTLKLSDKLWLMQTLASRYHLIFKELYAFSRWGQSCITGLFEKGGREFIFVPGDTVTLGWESFAQGMDKANQEELAELDDCLMRLSTLLEKFAAAEDTSCGDFPEL